MKIARKGRIAALGQDMSSRRTTNQDVDRSRTSPSTKFAVHFGDLSELKGRWSGFPPNPHQNSPPFVSYFPDKSHLGSSHLEVGSATEDLCRAQFTSIPCMSQHAVPTQNIFLSGDGVIKVSLPLCSLAHNQNLHHSNRISSLVECALFRFHSMSSKDNYPLEGKWLHLTCRIFCTRFQKCCARFLLFFASSLIYFAPCLKILRVGVVLSVPWSPKKN